MEAIIAANNNVVAFHLFRTITKAVMEDNNRVNTVETTVIKREFPKERQNFIFSIAFGKF